MSKPAEKHPDARREERVRLWMIGVFATVFVGVMLVFFVLAIFDVPLKPDNFTNSYSTSPGGHSALAELLRESGRDVRTTSGTLLPPEDEGDDTNTLVLLEPQQEFVDRYSEEFEGLFATAREDHTSIVLSYPKRDYELADEQPDDGDIVLWEDLIAKSSLDSVHGDTGFDRWFALTRLAGPIEVSWYDGSTRVTIEEPVQVFRPGGNWPDELEVLAETADGDVVVVRWLTEDWRDTGGVILISDPDFLTNRFIAREGAGEFCMKIFAQTPRRGEIMIDEDLHGFSTDTSLEYLAATPPGLWVTLSAFALLLVFAWRQATVLRPQSAEAQDRRARKYAIDGLARMMERAGDHHTAYRRVLLRSRFVLGKGAAQVQGAGMGGDTAQMGATGRITRIHGANDAERLVAAARRVAQLKRTGETEHGDWE